MQSDLFEKRSFVLGIVGHEGAKFAPKTEQKAKDVIYRLIERYKPTAISSGHCPLGGIDIWAEDIAKELNIPTLIFAPKQFKWDAEYGYKQRNLDIAKSDLVANLVVDVLPSTYKSYRFDGCYHCNKELILNGKPIPNHVKSGGCWTMWRCKNRLLEVIKQEE